MKKMFKLMVVMMMVMAVEVFIDERRPARLLLKGHTDDMPRPMRANPMVAGIR